MATTTVLEDTPEHTITQIVGDAPGNTSITKVYKPGSPGFNQDAMQSKMAAALSALEFADANWATISPTQQLNANHLAVRCTAKLIRFALNQFDAN